MTPTMFVVDLTRPPAIASYTTLFTTIQELRLKSFYWERLTLRWQVDPVCAHRLLREKLQKQKFLPRVQPPN